MATRRQVPFAVLWVVVGTAAVLAQALFTPSMSPVFLVWSTLANSTLLLWLGLPLMLVPPLLSPILIQETQLLRSGSLTRRRRWQTVRTAVVSAVVLASSIAVWSASASIAIGIGGGEVEAPAPNELLLLGLQACLLICTATVVRGLVFAAIDFAGIRAAAGTGAFIWIWFWMSERGIIPTTPPWSAIMLIDIRVAASSLVFAVSVALALLGLAILGWLATAWRENGNHVALPQFRFVHALFLGVALAAAAAAAGGRLEEPFWVVLTAVFGLSAIGPVSGIVTLTLFLLLPAVAQSEAMQVRSVGWYPALMRFGSSRAWVISSVRKWFGPIALYVAAVFLGIGLVYFSSGARDFSGPPAGWPLTIATYIGGGYGGLLLSVVLTLLCVLYVRSEAAGVIALSLIAFVALVTSSTPAGLPRIVPDLALTQSWQAAHAGVISTLALASASVAIAIKLATRHHPVTQ